MMSIRLTSDMTKSRSSHVQATFLKLVVNPANSKIKSTDLLNLNLTA
jgi:hypothetical protein